MTRVIDRTFKQNGDRNAIRKAVVEVFLEEQPGCGGGDSASKYRYNVEMLQDGRRVFLTRPAYLKKGFDFLIHLECATFQTGRDHPKHDDIKDDLATKLREDKDECRQLYSALCRVWACEDPEDILKDYDDLAFRSGLSVEALVKIVKWFLIEQDIRDWNYSGRNMFKEGVIDLLKGRPA